MPTFNLLIGALFVCIRRSPGHMSALAFLSVVWRVRSIRTYGRGLKSFSEECRLSRHQGFPPVEALRRGDLLCIRGVASAEISNLNSANSPASSVIAIAPAAARLAAPRTHRIPQSDECTSTCTVAVTLFENSSRRLENFARSAPAAVAQFMPISQLRQICCEYGLEVSTLLLPGSRRRTRSCPIRRLGSRSPTAFRSSMPGRLKTSYVSSDLVRICPDATGVCRA